MFSSLVYDQEKRRAILRVYDSEKNYIIMPSKPKKVEIYSDIYEVRVEDKIKKVEIINKMIEIIGDVIECSPLSTRHTLFCEAKEGGR